MTDVVLVGRSSSHFTRVARIFALDLGVPHTFRPVFDILSLDTASFAGNPALKVPLLLDERGPLFGTENICRELTRRAKAERPIVLRGESPSRHVANAEEMALHVMATEVTLIQSKLAKIEPTSKLRPSLENALAWLDANLERALAELPSDRQLSFLEAAVFSVVTHLPFREVMDVSPYVRLGAFVAQFGERPSAKQTPYAFDAP